MSNIDAQLGSAQPGNEDVLSWDIRTTDMSAEMRILLAEYPRDSWEFHAGFER